MKELDILEFPDARLRKKASKVKKISSDIEKLAGDMAYTMYSNDGIGLAATQVNQHKRMIVMDTSENQTKDISQSSAMLSINLPKLGQSTQINVPFKT